MAVKKTDVKEDNVDDTSNVKKSVEKKNVKKGNDVGDKKTLIDLVNNCDKKYTYIIINLSKNNLINQYYDELEKSKEGELIIPTISEDEFDKMMR